VDRARLLALKQDFAAALEDVSKMVLNHPEYLMYRGQMLYQVKRFAESERDLTAALTLKPDWPECL